MYPLTPFGSSALRVPVTPFFTTLVISLALSACGGGGSEGASAPSTPVVSTFSSGSIDGFGSIIVNNVRYDESKALVSNEDGNSASNDSLKLGMVVDVLASTPTVAAQGLPTAIATNVRYRSEVEGPITAIDIAARTLTVLGQAVQLTDATVFDDALRGGLNQLSVGSVVEIYGFLSADGHYTASRIEQEDTRDDDPYKLRGLVRNLNTAASTFEMGGITINYAGAIRIPSDFGNGTLLRVRLQRASNTVGHWVATELNSGTPTTSAPGNNTPSDTTAVQAEIEGYITSTLSTTRFVVSGITVDTTQARQLAPNLTTGSLVEVEGRLVKGVLYASEVEVKRRIDRDSGFEIEGRITSLNSAAQTFEVRGVTVNYANARFEEGSVAQLRVGLSVEVRGSLASDGTTLTANLI